MSWNLKRYLHTQQVVLIQHRNTLIPYLQQRLEVGDFHGVSDAANDIREIESKLEFIDEMLAADDQNILPELQPAKPLRKG